MKEGYVDSVSTKAVCNLAFRFECLLLKENQITLIMYLT